MPPDVVLAFLPPEEGLRDTLATLTAVWPDALRFGCESVTQFADDEMTTRGTLQLFWFNDPQHHRATLEVIPGTHGEPPTRRRIEAVARRIAAADGALLLVDGLRFPAEHFLGELRRTLVSTPPFVAGGLASQREPVTQAGSRVFVGDRVLPSACLVVTLHGVTMQVEVVRGWSPASPGLHGHPRRGRGGARDRRRAGGRLVPPLLHRRRRARADARRGQPLPADRRGAAAGAPGALPQHAPLRRSRPAPSPSSATSRPATTCGSAWATTSP